jgi:hypothetical protein
MNKAKWLAFLDGKNVKDVLEDVYIPFDRDFLVAQVSTGMATVDLEVSLLEVYHIEANSGLQANRVGIWKYGHGVTWSSEQYFKRRGNLRGMTLKAAVYPQVSKCLCTAILSIFGGHPSYLTLHLIIKTVWFMSNVTH